MNIFPAVDLLGGKAVRLYKGDYEKVTAYNENPLSIAKEFEEKGARFIHLVDLEGAKTGGTPHMDVVRSIAAHTTLFTEVGGGIRDMATVDAYLKNGVNRVILGTAAVTDEAFLKAAIEKYGERIAVGIDLKDGFVAIKGWTENSQYTGEAFFEKMEKMGVKTIICTDISKDGAMKGTNRELYRELSQRFSVDIVASGGVSSIDDVKALREMDLYGAIIGKAYYIGAIDLAQAIEVAK